MVVLSQGRNPREIVAYLSQLFDGVSSLGFGTVPGNAAEVILEVQPKVGLNLVLGSPLRTEGHVENWLRGLEEQMRATLHGHFLALNIEEVNPASASTRREWVDRNHAQVALVFSQIIFTKELTHMFQDKTIKDSSVFRRWAAEVLEERLNRAVEQVRSDQTTPGERLKYSSLITQDVHNRDIVQVFITNKVTEIDNFYWQSKLRYEWTAKRVELRLLDWSRPYGLEFTGSYGRLVITPLTDRCYVTIALALTLQVGASFMGPAGTGKTETVKDMARACGLPFFVFNCSEQMRRENMLVIFAGLAQTGAWGIFDEFNRIELRVLSVVATQMKVLFDALRENRAKFYFMEEGEIPLCDSVGIFVTMNIGYEGRTELPENVKSLFRPCAMIMPDLSLIC
jgi:dynein heavy chain